MNTQSLRDRLAVVEGPAYWRSLEELAGTDEFRQVLEREFPALADQCRDGVSRRNMLKVMAASLGLLGLSGCFFKPPQGQIAPYANPPQENIPGRPMYFATAMPFDGYGKGVLALSQEGRPTKIEGNPDHPASLGSSDIFMQASILDLYDPDRSRNVQLAGQIARWGDFQSAMMDRLERKRKNGEGLRLLLGTSTSPALAAQLDEIVRQFPGASWHQYDPVRDPGGLKSNGPFQSPVNTFHDFNSAGVVVSFADDFLHSDPASIRYARQFFDGRRVRENQQKMNRLYVIESTMTLTGSMADNRLALPPSRIVEIAAALAHRLGAATQSINPSLTPEINRWIDAIAADLMHPPDGQATLVIAGQNQPPVVHALAHAINQKLGNIGRAVFYTDPAEIQGGRPLNELVDDMHDGRVDTLLIIGGNPVYNAPADISFSAALDAMSRQMRSGDYANFTVHLSAYYDETSYQCQWHIPRAHWLETWGDVRAFDGTASIIQPLIAPLFAGKSEWELLETMLGRPDRSGIEIIRGYWNLHYGGGDFEKWWMTSLQKGVIDGSAFDHRQPPALAADIFSAPAPVTQPGSIEVLFQPDPTIWSGDFANNAWLQELPKPFTKLTWDNAAVINIAMAEKLGGTGGMLRDGDVVRITYNGRQLDAPVILLPGQADDMITLHLGYGRTVGGQVLLEDKAPRGYNAYRLRTSDAPWIGAAQVVATGTKQELVVTCNHHAMSALNGVPGIAPGLKPESIAQPGDSAADLALENRKLIRTATLDQFKADPHFVEKLEGEKKKISLTLYPEEWKYDRGLQWGMSIDMTACMGCNACVVACQAENNIPVVGKDQVARQREMHWIRIDDYFGGSLDSPTVYHQPVPCMHCENAPCEYVCPVGATTHSDEGLNEMTYNRCVGTRYCSNNCPYKVRRFNFYLFSDYNTPSLKLLHNPDVTVRSRGVMEKCTYCVQRIDQTRIEMEKQMLDLQEQARVAPTDTDRQRLLRQADERGRQIVRSLQTACQQACPTQAIIFGDIRDPGSEVAQLKEQPTNYGLLTDLTTKPRTTYLARVRNPNPVLQTGSAT